jgi:hypothetical protein
MHIHVHTCTPACTHAHAHAAPPPVKGRKSQTQQESPGGERAQQLEAGQGKQPMEGKREERREEYNSLGILLNYGYVSLPTGFFWHALVFYVNLFKIHTCVLTAHTHTCVCSQHICTPVRARTHTHTHQRAALSTGRHMHSWP